MVQPAPAHVSPVRPGAAPAVLDLVEPLARRLAEEPGVVAVILLGSAARGELAEAEVAGRRELFSDIELLAVTDGRLAAGSRAAATRDLERIADAWGFASPLFHVDVAFRERSRLGRLPPFVFTFELVARGRTVHGPDLRSEIRPVDLASLDRRNTHEILMKRLWAIAEMLPSAWVRGQPLDEVGRRTLGVALHRNPLDVTTVLLPEAGVLLPTYAERVRAWRDHPKLPFRTSVDRALGWDSAAYLEACLARRATAEPAPDPVAAYRDAVTFIGAALAWLAARGDGTAVMGRAGDATAAGHDGGAARAERRPGPADLPPGLFNERPVTPGEAVALVRQAVRIAYTCGPLPAARWARAARKRALAAGLLDLHTALLAWRAGDDPATAESTLDRAVAHLAPVALPGPALAAAVTVSGASLAAAATDTGPALAADAADAPDFAERWLAARALAGRAFWRTVRLGDPAAWRRIARTIGWEVQRV